MNCSKFTAGAIVALSLFELVAADPRDIEPHLHPHMHAGPSVGNIVSTIAYATATATVETMRALRDVQPLARPPRDGWIGPSTSVVVYRL